MISNNFAYKLFALAVALVIWGYARQSLETPIQKEIQAQLSREITVPLLTREPAEGFAVTRAQRTVDIFIEGRKQYVEVLASDPGRISAFVSLDSLREGTHKLPVIIQLPEGYEDFVTAVPIPADVFVTLQKQAQREFPVSMRFTGIAAGKYAYAQPAAFLSQKVVARGLSRDLDSISQVVAEVDVTDSAAGSVEGDYPVIALDASGKALNTVSLFPKTVHLKAYSGESAAMKRVALRPKTIGQPPVAYRVGTVELKPNMITVTGSIETLRGLDSLETEPIRLVNRTKSFSQQVRIIAPSGIFPADAETVRAFVTIIPSSSAPLEPSGIPQ